MQSSTLTSLFALSLAGTYACSSPSHMMDKQPVDQAKAVSSTGGLPEGKETAQNAKQRSIPAGQLLASGTIDWQADTVTLPLHQGSLKDGRSVWYVLTDVSDAQKAKELGLNFAPSLGKAAKVSSTRSATVDAKGEFVFNTGAIDFAPKHAVTPGAAPNYFPPTAVTPGSVAAEAYSPFVAIDGVVYNAPMIAFNTTAAALNFCDGSPNLDTVHDKVVKFCPATGTVTLALTHGFSGGKEIAYLSFDANIDLPAALENATLNTAEDDLKGAGVSIPLYAVVNGQIGSTNPNHQGFNSALAGDGSPLNILAGTPTIDGGYSPLWDVRMAVWTDQAVQAKQTTRLESGAAVTKAAADGLLTGPAGAALGASGILVNCPVVAYVTTK